MAGGAVLVKQDSEYHEHFYDNLLNGTHFLGFKADNSDLGHVIRWLRDHDRTAQHIAEEGKRFYYTELLAEPV